MKSKVTINVDSFIYEEAKLYRVNISRTTEDALRSYISVMKGDLSTADEALIKRRLETAERKLAKLQGEVSGYRENLAKISQIKEKKEEKRLVNEKDKIESAKRCINCGTIHEGDYKWKVFPAGIVCNSCYLSSDNSSVSKWMNKT